MKWPDDIDLFVNHEGPPVDIWHDGGPGGPFLTAADMETAQAIIDAIDELHQRRAEVADLRLSLAAERDDPTAGKDLGYDLIHGVYVRHVEGGHIEVELYRNTDNRWRAYRFAKGEVVPPWRSVWGETAREVMRKANELEGR